MGNDEKDIPPQTEYQVKAWEEDRKRQRSHQWRMQHPKEFLIENLTDWIGLIIIVFIIVMGIYGCAISN